MKRDALAEMETGVLWSWRPFLALTVCKQPVMWGLQMPCGPMHAATDNSAPDQQEQLCIAVQRSELLQALRARQALQC